MIAIMIPAPFDSLPTHSLRQRRFADGGLLFAQGDASLGPWVVLQGEVRLIRQGETGLSVCLHRARAGETLAEASLFSDRYHCDAEALPGTLVVNVARDATLRRMQEDAGFARALAALLARQVQDGRRRLAFQRIRRADERVLAALAELGAPDRIVDFAAEVGLTPEATYRALATLVQRGLVRKTARGRYFLASV